MLAVLFFRKFDEKYMLVMTNYAKNYASTIYQSLVSFANCITPPLQLTSFGDITSSKKNSFWNDPRPSKISYTSYFSPFLSQNFDSPPPSPLFL